MSNRLDNKINKLENDIKYLKFSDEFEYVVCLILGEMLNIIKDIRNEQIKLIK